MNQNNFTGDPQKKCKISFVLLQIPEFVGLVMRLNDEKSDNKDIASFLNGFVYAFTITDKHPVLSNNKDPFYLRGIDYANKLIDRSLLEFDKTSSVHSIQGCISKLHLNNRTVEELKQALANGTIENGGKVISLGENHINAIEYTIQKKEQNNAS